MSNLSFIQLVVQRVQHKKLDEISEEDQNSKVAKQVEFIMDALKREYRNNNKKPISYYGFVVDPTSFSNTIENIFYVSFLVKDGLASLDSKHACSTLFINRIDWNVISNRRSF